MRKSTQKKSVIAVKKGILALLFTALLAVFLLQAATPAQATVGIQPTGLH